MGVKSKSGWYYGLGCSRQLQKSLKNSKKHNIHKTNHLIKIQPSTQHLKSFVSLFFTNKQRQLSQRQNTTFQSACQEASRDAASCVLPRLTPDGNWLASEIPRCFTASEGNTSRHRAFLFHSRLTSSYSISCYFLFYLSIISF